MITRGGKLKSVRQVWREEQEALEPIEEDSDVDTE